MKCPHCQVSFHHHENHYPLSYDDEVYWEHNSQTCPACHKLIIELIAKRKMSNEKNDYRGPVLSRVFIVPKGITRPNPNVHVPKEYADDYIQASLVLADSPMASAALSRRCLQHLIRNVARIKEKDLATEIQKLIDSKTLPSHLIESVDAIRNIGNFAAHPIKSTSTGEIIEVEAGEAEWNLDVLDDLFDFYFVQPAVTRAKRAALDAKLASAGKPPIK